jgi:hypothetical protein
MRPMLVATSTLSLQRTTLAVAAAVGMMLLQSAAGHIQCGDGQGDRASNWFGDIECGSYQEGKYGQACADDFNVWCCPHNYGCRGNFDDPGGNNHCQTADAVSGDCTYCPNRPDRLSPIPGTGLGVCLNKAAWGACPQRFRDFSLNLTDFVRPDTETECRFYCCPAKGQYCIDKGCVEDDDGRRGAPHRIGSVTNRTAAD